ncbi:hypothetical protein A2W24_04670 [Microgenomates group bacterium RBG_16_45_19]|nr:MAG: hypothetical protein A2W24_04670 [Microgenomates group bacterium RBG_16_45_19]
MAGFTMIESLISVALVAVVVITGIAGYTEFQEKQQVRTAASSMVQELLEVQKKTRQGETSDCRSGRTLAGYKLKLETSEHGNDLKIMAICRQGETPHQEIATTFETVSQVQIESMDPTEVTFTWPDGVPGEDVEIQLLKDDSHECVIISKDGAIRAEGGEC